jgi:hypothetical protein
VVRVWEPTTRTLRAELRGVQTRDSVAALDGKGSVLAVADQEGRVTLRSVERNAQVREMNTGVERPTAIAFSTAGRLFALGSRTGQLSIFDTASGKARARGLPQPRMPVDDADHRGQSARSEVSLSIMKRHAEWIEKGMVNLHAVIEVPEGKKVHPSSRYRNIRQNRKGAQPDLHVPASPRCRLPLLCRSGNPKKSGTNSSGGIPQGLRRLGV